MKKMKLIRVSLLLFLLICSSYVSFSQGFSTGIYSGVNLSDIHGQSTGGEWDSKPGPASGINLAYSLTKTIGFQTGVNFSTVYYEHKQLSYPVTYYDYMYLSSSYIDPRIIAPYYPADSKMDYSFLRIPLLFTVAVPSVLQLEMRAGIFFSFLQDYSTSSNYFYYYSSSPEKPEKHDFGYIFSSGLSYPFNDNFKASFNASYITGRKPFQENYSYRHGSSEFTLGIEYTGLLKHKNRDMSSIPSDSLSKHVTVTIKGGLGYSWNGGSEPNGDYNGCFGPVIGFSLNIPLSKNVFFQTGFTFERKGYSIRDSSSSFYRLDDDATMYDVDTKIQTDYAIIPAVFSFGLGKPGKLYFSTGPWLGLKLNARTVGNAYNEDHTDYSYQLKETIVNDDLEESIENYDIGWLFGLGTRIPVSKCELDLSVQYSAGLREMFRGTSYMAYADGDKLALKNRTVSLVLGFKIPLR
jgi:hypothetical protein